MARLIAIRGCIGIVALLMTTIALAASRVDIVLGVDPQFPATSQRDWFDLFTSLKADNVQIRSAIAGEKIEIVSQGAAGAQRYRVLGRLTPANEVILPGGRFALRDRAGIARWLETLRTEGPDRAQGAPRLPFGISSQQLAQVKADLGRTVDFNTVDESPKAVLEKLAARLAHPLLADDVVRATLALGEPITDELKGVAIGTVIANILKSVGLVFTPRVNSAGRLEYFIATSRAASEAWPIGWPIDKTERDALPAMVEMINVEIDKIAAAEVVRVVSERLETPAIHDRVAMARHGIDPAKVTVSIKGGQSMYAIVLRKSLFSAGLKYELRLDDAKRPFLWITTLKP